MHTMTNNQRRKNVERDKGRKARKKHTPVVVLASLGGLLLIGGVVCWLRFDLPKGDISENLISITGPCLLAAGALCCVGAGLVGLYIRTRKPNAVQDVKPATTGTTVTLSQQHHGHHGQQAGYDQYNGGHYQNNEQQAGYDQHNGGHYQNNGYDHNNQINYEQQQAPFDSPYEQSDNGGYNQYGGENNDSYDNDYYSQTTQDNSKHMQR